MNNKGKLLLSIILFLVVDLFVIELLFWASNRNYIGEEIGNPIKSWGQIGVTYEVGCTKIPNTTITNIIRENGTLEVTYSNNASCEIPPRG